MRVHLLQHVPFEGPGSIAEWLRGRAAEVGVTRVWAGDALPAFDGLDLVVALGGPMSIGDRREHPWLAAEEGLLAEAVSRGVAVLGICLGAQLLASSLGARVYPGENKEIGWFPLRGTAGEGGRAAAPPAGALRLPERFDAFHWHGDTFDLPAGAELLASSEACRNQAFRVGRSLGLQFHLEATPEGVRALVDACAGELVGGPYVQDEERLLAAPAETYAAANALMAAVLDHLARPIGHPG